MIRLEKMELSGIVSKLREMQACFYCGEYAREIEHVVPRHTGLPTWTVFSCVECNAMAGGIVFSSALEKLTHLREKRRKRYARVLRMPEWTEDETAELGKNMRKIVEAWAAAKESICSQLVWNPLEQT